MDVVWGDLSAALSPEALKNVDVSSPDPHRLAGHCTVFRNSEKMNHLFLEAPELKKVPTASHITFFDEGGMSSFLFYRNDVLKKFAPEKPQDGKWNCGLTLCYGRETLPDLQGGLTARWDNGKLFVTTRKHGTIEMAYLHFVALKQFWHWFRFDPSTRYDQFYFNFAGFHSGLPKSRAISSAPLVDALVYQVDFAKKNVGRHMGKVIDIKRVRKFLRR